MQSPSLQNVLTAPEASHYAAVSGQCADEGEQTKFNVRGAVAASLFLHAVLALVLFASPVQTLQRGIQESLPAIYVTWADATLFAEKKQAVAAVLPAPAKVTAVIRQERLPLVSPVAAAHPVESVSNHVANEPIRNEQEPATSAEASVAVPVVPKTGSGDGRRSGLPPASAPADSGISGGTSAITMAKPRYRDNKPPVYPLESRLRGHQGMVLISAEVLPDGRTGVMKIRTSSGYYALDQSALQAVRTWKFEPARKTGQPVAAWVDIPVRFSLKNE